METRQRTVVNPAPGRRHMRRSLGRLFLGVAISHPLLAAEAVRFALATSAPGWFRKPPFLPVPEPEYRDWRLITAYGRTGHLPSPVEVEDFLRWRRSIRRSQ